MIHMLFPLHKTQISNDDQLKNEYGEGTFGHGMACLGLQMDIFQPSFFFLLFYLYIFVVVFSSFHGLCAIILFFLYGLCYNLQCTY